MNLSLERDFHKKFPFMFPEPLMRFEDPVKQVVCFDGLQELSICQIRINELEAVKKLIHPLKKGLLSWQKVIQIAGDNDSVRKAFFDGVNVLVTQQFLLTNQTKDLCYLVKVYYLTICFELVCHTDDKTLTSDVIENYLLRIDSKQEELRIFLA